ncbi:MAG: transposase, partial [bacterium]
MSRQPRIVIPDTPHHVTQRGNLQQPVFQQDNDYRTYCRLMNRYSKKCGISLLAFCLMGNHVHIIAVPPTKSALAQVFHSVNTRYATYFNDTRRRKGHLWQARYWSCPMDDAHLRRAIRYVERNPVRAGLVKDPWDYKWSSAAAHAREGRSPIEVCDSASIAKQSGWKDYMQTPDTLWEKKIRQSTRKGLPVGTEVFIEKLEHQLGRILTPQKPGRR